MMKRWSPRVLALVAVLQSSRLAAAADPKEEEARALFAEGNDLLDRGNYVEALEKFKAAYARWANPKILLNVGATLRQLGRNAEAADVYERYLRDPEADPFRVEEVRSFVAKLDAMVGKVRIVARTKGTTVRIDDKVVLSEGTEVSLRLEPGTHTLLASSAGMTSRSETLVLAAGEARTFEVVLLPLPPPPATAPPKTAEAPLPPPRFGALLRADADARARGALTVVGFSASVVPRIDVALSAMIGAEKGLGLEVWAALLDARVTPRLHLSLPCFFIDGPRLGMAGGAGVLAMATRHLGGTIELNTVYFPGLPATYERWGVLLSIGGQVRW